MGGRMASRLLAAGYDLTVYNRTAKRTRPLEQRVEGRRDAGRVVPASTCCSQPVADMPRSRGDVGTRRRAGRGSPGTIFLEMSTVSGGRLQATARHRPSQGGSVSTLRSSAALRRRSKGARIFVAGEEEVYRRCARFSLCSARSRSTWGQPAPAPGPSSAGDSLLGVGFRRWPRPSRSAQSGLPRERFLQVLGDTAVLSPSRSQAGETLARTSIQPRFRCG